MATGTSRRRGAARGAATLALLAAATAAAFALATGSSGHSPARASAAGTVVAAPGALLAALGPRPAASGWPAATIASGAATLRHPPDWPRVAGDAGTVSFALRSSSGRYLGYLNVTPQQGAERLRGWGAFRVRRNREEGDRGVTELASREGIVFPGGRGSCVIDDYASRVGSNPYRELACIVRGRSSASVVVAAASRPEWPRLAPRLVRATEAFAER